MLPGLNHNVRYKERLFHVQTEDSGLDRPVLMTHVFIDGSIIATQKGDYQALLDQKPDDLALKNAVRKQMQEQHKSSIKCLLRGEYDSVISQFVPEISSLPAATSEPPPAPRSQPPSFGAKLTSVPPPATLSATEESAPTERPRPSQPIPNPPHPPPVSQFEELDFPILDPAEFADDEDILASLESLPALPAELRDEDPNDTLLDMPVFDPNQTLPPTPTPIEDTQPPKRVPAIPDDRTMHDPLPPSVRAELARRRQSSTPAPTRGRGLPTTPSPPRPEGTQPPTKDPFAEKSPPLMPPRRPDPRSPATRVIDRDAQRIWPESPEPLATQEFDAWRPEYPTEPPDSVPAAARGSSPPTRGSGGSKPPGGRELPSFPGFGDPRAWPSESQSGFDVARTAPRQKALEPEDIPIVEGEPIANAPVSWPPQDARGTAPPDGDVPDFLLGQDSKRPASDTRAIRVEDASLDDIITGYLEPED